MNTAWYREEAPEPMTLRGSKKIIYDALTDLLTDGERPPSVTALSCITGYHESTVKRTLRSLRDVGLILYHQPRQGCRANYAILRHPEEA